ncbi:TetR/AcrR family transcriptional regulator [Patulibacter minatonensis]|uniref:TetR/AcrR family transcriptional regulator n=1 Tax=Patulibacter minatonensis TaxID=298163 RepID=UPI000685C848|nr:TetR/AcrR family transcriptional regulator [Patulibacter minatonensis]
MPTDPPTDRLPPPTPAVGDFPHGRVPRQVREQQVLSIAQGLFAERGYQGASMDELAARAGVSKPVVYDLVGSKESLYLRCVERAGQALAQVVATAALTETDPEERMRAGAVAFLRFVAEEQGGWDLLLTAGPEPGAEPILAIRAQQSALLTALTRETVEGLGVRLDEWRVEALAHALNGAFEGLAYWWRANRDVPPDELVDWIITLFYPGIRALAGLADHGDT